MVYHVIGTPYHLDTDPVSRKVQIRGVVTPTMACATSITNNFCVFRWWLLGHVGHTVHVQSMNVVMATRACRAHCTCTIRWWLLGHVGHTVHIQSMNAGDAHHAQVNETQPGNLQWGRIVWRLTPGQTAWTLLIHQPWQRWKNIELVDRKLMECFCEEMKHDALTIFYHDQKWHHGLNSLFSRLQLLKVYALKLSQGLVHVRNGVLVMASVSLKDICLLWKYTKAL